MHGSYNGHYRVYILLMNRISVTVISNIPCSSYSSTNIAVAGGNYDQRQGHYHPILLYYYLLLRLKVGATLRCLFFVEDIFFGLHKFQYQKKDEKESDQTIAIVQYTIQYYIYIYTSQAK